MNNLKVLVVDDDPVTRILLNKILTRADYDVVLAENGAEAMELISNNYYDVVITDLMMPGDLDGIDVLAGVKSQSKDTEVFLLTGHASVDTAITAMKKGATDYLKKPLNVDELFLRLNRIKEMKVLAKNAGDLREAMDITEKNASTTIQTMEMTIADLENKLSEIREILSDTAKEAHSRVDAALRTL